MLPVNKLRGEGWVFDWVYRVWNVGRIIGFWRDDLQVVFQLFAGMRSRSCTQ